MKDVTEVERWIDATSNGLPYIPARALVGKLAELGCPARLLQPARQAFAQREPLQLQRAQAFMDANVRLRDVIERYQRGQADVADVVAARNHAEAVKAAEQDLRAAEQMAERRGTETFWSAVHPMWEWLRSDVAGLVDAVAESLDGVEPDDVWPKERPSDALATMGRDAVLGAGARLTARWEPVQTIAEQLRPHVGADYPLSGSAPRLAGRWRRWWLTPWWGALPAVPMGAVSLISAGSIPLRNLDRSLRLAYAVHAGWEPGVWGPDDVLMPPTDKPITPPAPNKRLLGGLFGPKPQPDPEQVSVA